MHVAEVLSDLTSLRACDPNEALALVNVNRISDAHGDSQATATDTQKDAEDSHTELSRAKELVDLHYGVKVKYMGSGPNHEPSVDEDLQRAREDVNRVLREVNEAQEARQI